MACPSTTTQLSGTQRSGGRTWSRSPPRSESRNRPLTHLERETTVRVRSLLAGGLMAAGMSAAGIAFLAGPASAHDLTGGSAQATCEGQTVQVTWNFVSENAGDNAIQSVTFNRAVSS